METKHILSEEEFKKLSVSSAFCEIILKMELKRQESKELNISSAQRAIAEEMDLHQLLKLIGVLAENIKELKDKEFAELVLVIIKAKFYLLAAT